jgi:hypothetical protein
MTSIAAILTRATVETDDGQESVWATSALDVPCWVYEATPLSGMLGAIAGAVGISETFSIRLPIGTAVLSGDQIAVNGKEYAVQSVNADDTYPAWLKASARLIE